MDAQGTTLHCGDISYMGSQSVRRHSEPCDFGIVDMPKVLSCVALVFAYDESSLGVHYRSIRPF